MAFPNRLKPFVPLHFREEKLMFNIKLMYWLRDKHFAVLARMLWSHIYYKYHVDIAVTSKIHPTVRFPHPLGIVVGSGVEIGADSVVFQNVTFGAKVYEGGEWRFPKVEKNVKIYPNTSVIGDVVVRDNCIIGAGSVVTHSTERGGVYFGSPARILRKQV